MIDEIRQFLRKERLQDNIAVATLVDTLYAAGEECLAEDIEEVLDQLKLSSSTRVGTLLFALEQNQDSREPDEDEEDD